MGVDNSEHKKPHEGLCVVMPMAVMGGVRLPLSFDAVTSGLRTPDLSLYFEVLYQTELPYPRQEHTTHTTVSCWLMCLMERQVFFRTLYLPLQIRQTLQILPPIRTL